MRISIREELRERIKQLIAERYSSLHTFMWEDYVVITAWDGERNFVYYRDGINNFLNVAERVVQKNKVRKIIF